MELIAVQLARVAAFLEILSLDPKGQTTVPEGIAGFAKRYAFQKSPQSVAEMDFQKGVQFAAGRHRNVAIEQIQLFNNGIAIDTRSSTDNCLLILQDILDNVMSTMGVSVGPTKRHFVSQIAFRSDLKLSLLHPMLQPIADRLGAETSSALNHPIIFEPTAILIGPDTSQLKLTPSMFSIERRIETPFGENTYFSGAPLTTTEHFELIEEVEEALRER